MEQEGDFSVTVPLIFTALAVILATVLIKLFSGGEKQPAEPVPEQKEDKVVEAAEREDQKDKEEQIVEDKEAKRTEREAVPVEDVGAADELPQLKDNEPEMEQCVDKESPSSLSSQEEEEDSKEEDFETESDKILKIKEAEDADDEDLTFKYVPGKLRGSDYEKMLTKDELEEEQRIELTSDLTSL